MEIESIEHCRVGSTSAYLIAVPAASTSRAPEATPVECRARLMTPRIGGSSANTRLISRLATRSDSAIWRYAASWHRSRTVTGAGSTSGVQVSADLGGHALLAAHPLSHADPVDLARHELTRCVGACRICPWPA